MKEKRANLQAFKQKAKVVLSRYKDLFPNWVRAYSVLLFAIILLSVVCQVLSESRYFPHPLSTDYTHRYRTVTKLDPTCPQ